MDRAHRMRHSSVLVPGINFFVKLALYLDMITMNAITFTREIDRHRCIWLRLQITGKGTWSHFIPYAKYCNSGNINFEHAARIGMRKQAWDFIQREGLTATYATAMAELECRTI